ncbi:hypothetical protein ACFQDD_13325 [Halorubrum pallidum]|uniref:Uncharacterized protein n=1 Tax=Halorubrum pallidum TaxID=1526114 RepID=A0ABD5TAA4_9EURY
MAPTYINRAPEGETVDHVDGMDVMGARVMVGHYPGDKRLIDIADAYFITPEGAQHEFEHGLLPENLLPDDA